MDGEDGDQAADSDAALMARAARGDVQAFSQIYDRHAARALALAKRLLGDDAEAEDVLHDAFIEAWRAADAYDAQRSSVRTWLLIRVRSRALDRRARRVREAGARAASEHAQTLAPAKVTPSTERSLALRQAFALLKPDVREVLELTYFEGLTAAEVAQRSCIPVGTVKSRLARGLQSMHQYLSAGRDGERT